MDFEQRVYQREFNLNDIDDSIVDYIKKNRKQINTISIQKMAEELYISPNTIMRLARKLGYSGFAELKYSIQNETSVLDYQTITSKVFREIPQNIMKTLDINGDNDIDALATRMNRANKILFVGVGDTVYFCELFGRYLRCLNKKVEYFTHIHDCEYAAMQYEEGDMIIIISVSGKTKRLVDLAKKIKPSGVDLICITHYGENSLSQVCDTQICFWGEKRIVNNYNVTDHIGLMMIIRMICTQFWNNFSE